MCSVTVSHNTSRLVTSRPVTSGPVIPSAHVTVLSQVYIGI